eukprot:CAMPEP_0113521880 /NCGR_PEP_ID=MMETSP0014_2-20120614/44887_1 /TAXON_ID=2857 /ORGANISM="Nitzschia sp." /LENGTH=222 /DNA_ID=CAMNT_0000419891 /DNA_START=33 /DNA_END=698 /DNA_ORIENTATION=+ /assembly_acc=CAM_ASM_000159
MMIARPRRSIVTTAVILSAVAISALFTTEKVAAFSFSPSPYRHHARQQKSRRVVIISSRSQSSQLQERRNGNLFDLDTISDGIADFDVTEVIENTIGDDTQPFGSRGEVYFVAQAAMLFLIAIGGVPILDMLVGLAIGGLAVIDLGSDSLSPFPDPAVDGDLKTQGIYSKIRHPMYSALILACTGFSIWTNSADRLILTAILIYLLEVKSSKEEDFLVGKYG